MFMNLHIVSVMLLCHLATKFYIFLINLCELLIDNPVYVLNAKNSFSELFATSGFFF